jgi:Fe-S-cluster containining protein
MKTPKQRGDAVLKKHGPFFERLIAEAMRLVYSPEPLEPRARRVLEITDDLAAKVAPKAACRRGCAYCCYQSVIISDWEAERIARFTGRAMAEVAALGPLTDLRVTQKKFSGVPCTFLKGRDCSICAVRPLACRTHFNIGDDPEACNIGVNPGAMVPYFNFRALTLIHATMFLNAGCTFADVREYFPEAAP